MSVGCSSCLTDNCRERKMLLNEIGKIDFVLTDLALYLDTHPYDMQAIEKYKQGNMMKTHYMREFAEKYGPLMRSCTDMDSTEWKWSLQDAPWEGGYY